MLQAGSIPSVCRKNKFSNSMMVKFYTKPPSSREVPKAEGVLRCFFSYHYDIRGNHTPSVAARRLPLRGSLFGVFFNCCDGAFHLSAFLQSDVMLQAGSIPFFLFGFMKKNRRSSQSAVRSAAAVGKGRGEMQKIYGFSKKRMVFFQEYVIIDIIRSGAQNRIRRVCHEIPKCKKRYPQYFSLRDHHAVL